MFLVHALHEDRTNHAAPTNHSDQRLHEG